MNSKLTGMVMSVLLLTSFICLASSIAAAQSTPAASGSSHPVLLGTLNDGEYNNAILGFKLRVPPGFNVLSKAETDLYSNAGADFLKDAKGKNSKRIDSVTGKQAELLGVTQKPLGQPENATLEIVAVKEPNGISANMVLVANVGLITSSGKFKLAETFSNPRFGGLRFAGARVEGEINTVKFFQDSYVIIRRGYAITIGLSYTNDAGRTAMLKVLDSLVFTK